jgi:hypothetical protein
MSQGTMQQKIHLFFDETQWFCKVASSYSTYNYGLKYFISLKRYMLQRSTTFKERSILHKRAQSTRAIPLKQVWYKWVTPLPGNLDNGLSSITRPLTRLACTTPQVLTSIKMTATCSRLSCSVSCRATVASSHELTQLPLGCRAWSHAEWLRSSKANIRYPDMDIF